MARAVSEIEREIRGLARDDQEQLLRALRRSSTARPTPTSSGRGLKKLKGAAANWIRVLSTRSPRARSSPRRAIS
jgi:hypothetical protein